MENHLLFTCSSLLESENEGASVKGLGNSGRSAWSIVTWEREGKDEKKK
jgi:hypothetical protein